MSKKFTIEDVTRAVLHGDCQASFTDINTIRAVVKSALQIIALDCLVNHDGTAIDLGNGHCLSIEITPKKL